MRKLALSVILAFAYYVTAAVAQSGNSGNMGGSTGAQGTRQSSPSATSPNGPNGQVQPGTPAGTETPGVGQNTNGTDQNGAPSNMGDHASKGEKKLKGCVQSQGGQYVLESKHGKAVMLAGQDVSAHVGHEVKVKGTWESSSASGMSSTSTAGASNAASDKTFNVTNVEMVSETCKDSGSNSNSGSGMGAGSTGSSTTGSGTANSGSGNSGSTGTGTGSSTTPPQQ